MKSENHEKKKQNKKEKEIYRVENQQKEITQEKQHIKKYTATTATDKNKQKSDIMTKKMMMMITDKQIQNFSHLKQSQS